MFINVTNNIWIIELINKKVQVSVLNSLQLSEYQKLKDEIADKYTQCEHGTELSFAKQSTSVHHSL